MKVLTRLIFLNDKEEKFFGEGPYRLLKKVEETGSLHASAMALGMAYSKATKLLNNAEMSLGFPLTVRRIGGRSGGGSELTVEAKNFMKCYEAFRDECIAHNHALYEQYFGNSAKKDDRVGCVIMASGLGKRFGGDKLMAVMLEKPLLQYAIEATEGLFASRVVVTRNDKVKEWCEQRSIPVVFHMLPGRNDTIRLGLEAMESDALSACVFFPADMPFLSRDSLQEMVRLGSNKNDAIIRMSYKGTIGAPTLFGSDFFSDLKNLPDGKGGNVIMQSNPEKISFVECKEEYELWDVDTPEDYEIINNKMLEINSNK